MKEFPLFNQHSSRKPTSEFPEVAKAMSLGLTLTELKLTSTEAIQSGYVMVREPIPQRRAGMWAKGTDLEIFKAAENVLLVYFQEKQAKESKKAVNKLKKLLPALIESVTKDLSKYDKDHHHQSILKFENTAQLAQRSLRKSMALVQSLEKSISVDLVEFNQSFEDYGQTLEESIQDRVRRNKEEYHRSDTTLKQLKTLVPHRIMDPTFIDSFSQWSADGHLLTKNNILDKAGAFAKKSWPELAYSHIKKETKELKDLIRSLEIDAFIADLKSTIADIQEKSPNAVICSLHQQTLVPAEDLYFPVFPKFLVHVEGQIPGKEEALRELREQLQIDQAKLVKPTMSIDIKFREDLSLQIKSQYRMHGLAGRWKIRLVLPFKMNEKYQGPLLPNPEQRSLLELSEAHQRAIIFSHSFSTFLRSNTLLNGQDLDQKWQRFQQVCEAFIQRNEEKPGFDDFASIEESWHCSGFKNSMDFATILEGRFTDFYLARLATDHADIFKGRIDKRPRRVSFYAGPTNSGKSYQAFEILATHEKGVYLGPLRLLALEGVEELNKRGVIASLITGEERDIHPDASHTSQTVETFDRDARYDCAIIDEIQMITDKARGGAFMEALLNLNADHLILTGSENAVKIVQEICSLTGDEFKAHYLKRKNPLEWIGTYKLPRKKSSDLKGTAIIAFSKRSIHDIRNELLVRGYSVSVIYGALSPDVRRSEAERFRTGESEILVATDAIGMGLNLPIKRVLFSQSDKFNGEKICDLQPTEVLQIGGRAGRYGLSREAGEVGVINGLTHIPLNESVVYRGFQTKLRPLSKVYVSITFKQLLDSYEALNQELSKTIYTLTAKNKYTWRKAHQAWMVDTERYEKALILEEVATQIATEQKVRRAGTEALKHLQIPFRHIFRLINTPFDTERHSILLSQCFANVLRILTNKEPKVQGLQENPRDIDGPSDLEYAEGQVKTLTLHYYFASYYESIGSKSPYKKSAQEILDMRRDLGAHISDYLAQNEAMTETRKSHRGKKRSKGPRTYRKR